MLRTGPLAASLLVLAFSGFTAPALAEIVAVAVPVTVSVCSRTSLRISGEVLRFDVGPASGEASVAVYFSAAGRTARDGELVLSVEPVAASGDTVAPRTITFVGQGDGTRSGALQPEGPVVAARWTGSGRRDGSVIFTLRDASPGHYVVPLRFVLSTP